MNVCEIALKTLTNSQHQLFWKVPVYLVIFSLKMIRGNVFTGIKKIDTKILIRIFYISGRISFKFTRYPMRLI